MRLVLPGTGEPLASLVLAAGLFLLSMAWREFGLALGLYLACRALRAAALAQRERKAPSRETPGRSSPWAWCGPPPWALSFTGVWGGP